MLVETLFPTHSNVGQIEAGWQFEADLINHFYVVKDGFFKGSKLRKDFCKVVDIRYSEKEWNDMENEYMAALEKEKQEKERAQQMVRELTAQINNKNKEIEKLTFFLDCSSLALQVSCQAIETLKGNR